ncbi:MAG: WbqC family protein [Bacteroides sp.]|nr:WbqC family protein [Bacteroides sp.]MCM1379074.1 WbqC family protein [Bacteroides sp.]MCM1445772.1 WbqC family protein [Prevotella sp.]
MTDPEQLILPCRLAPPIPYYRAMALHPGPVAVNLAERFDKRCKAAHRFTIADTRGPLDLTVPIEKPYGATWADTRISLHGNWWELMTRALESAYGRTPYFEFYADDFLPLLSNPDHFTTVAVLVADFDRAIRRALFLPTQVTYIHSPLSTVHCPLPTAHCPTYWQVRAQTLGFIPGLSILDLIFNLGPESLAILTKDNGA